MRCSRCTSLRQTPRIGSTVAKKAKRDFVEKYFGQLGVGLQSPLN